MERRIANEKSAFGQQLAAEQKRHEEESASNVNQIKQLKAYLLRAREAKDAAEAATGELRSSLMSRVEEIEKLRSELELAQISASEVSDDSPRAYNHSLLQREKHVNEKVQQVERLRRDHDILTQKQQLLRRELDGERTLRHAHQRRLQQFEMIVDELSEHIYEPRRLQKNVLNLLAFFNSVPRSGLMQTNAQVKSTEKKTGVTKRVMHLGTSRNKAH